MLKTADNLRRVGESTDACGREKPFRPLRPSDCASFCRAPRINFAFVGDG